MTVCTELGPNFSCFLLQFASVQCNAVLQHLVTKLAKKLALITCLYIMLNVPVILAHTF